MDGDSTWYGGRPRPKRHCVRWGPSSRPLKGHSPKFSANVRCGQTPGWTKKPLGMEVGLGPGDFVFDGDRAQKRHSPHPIFGPCLLWPNGWIDQDAISYGNRLWPRPHCVRWGPSSRPTKGYSPQLSAHNCCGQMAAWIKMPLGMEVGLGLGDFVLDRDPASPPQKGG